jgi:hypothetical protein
MIDAGAALTQKLDESGLPVTTALWFFDSEIVEWRLLFASPEMGSEGPRAVYRKIFAALSELGDESVGGSQIGDQCAGGRCRSRASIEN